MNSYLLSNDVLVHSMAVITITLTGSSLLSHLVKE